jgi:hypothetical protein
MTGADQTFEHAVGLLRAIEFFDRQPVEEMMARARNRSPDLWCSMWAHPDFKARIYGREGAKHLDALVSLARERDTNARFAIHRSTLKSSIEWQFCERFLKKRQQLTPVSSDSMLKRAIAHASRKCRDGCIAVPCRVVHDAEPEAFEIGSVQFVRSKIFFETAQQNGHISSETVNSPIVISNLQTAPWIAVATYRSLDPKLGSERVLKAVHAALDLLAALLDPYRGDRMTTDAHASQATSTVSFARDEDGQWQLSWSKRALQTSLGDGWYDYLREQLGWFAEMGGKAVAGLLTRHQPFPLELRFLDGLHWLGLACREVSPANRIAACVFALERLSMTRDVEDLGKIARSFAQRTVVLAREFRGYQTSEWFQALLELYEVRSRLAHGDISPNDTSINQHAGFALTATRAALLGSLAVYASLSNGQGSDGDLRGYFERMAPSDTSGGLADPTGVSEMQQPDSKCNVHNSPMQKHGRSDSVLTDEKDSPIPVWVYSCAECQKQDQNLARHYVLLHSPA